VIIMLSNIEAERVRKQMSKEDMASVCDVTTKTYANWINEKTDVPSSALISMARLFGVTIDYLLEGASGVKGMT
jgi:DNA-binding XRE family transcriptional regulator